MAIVNKTGNIYNIIFIYFILALSSLRLNESAFDITTLAFKTTQLNSESGSIP